jgi:hypothetical protein
LIVKQDPPHTQFAALLNLSAAGSGWSAGNALRFNGLVRERKGRVLFLGIDRNEPDDIFIINVEPLYSSRGKLFTGLATSARADEIDARRIALEYAPDQSRICPLARKCGLVSSEDESIHPWARAAISAENAYEPLVFRPRKLNALMKT